MSYLQLIKGAKNIYSTDKFLKITGHKWFDKYSYFLIYDVKSTFDYTSTIEISFWEGTNDINISPLIYDEWIIDLTKQLQKYFSLLGFNVIKWI